MQERRSSSWWLIWTRQLRAVTGSDQSAAVRWPRSLSRRRPLSSRTSTSASAVRAPSHSPPDPRLPSQSQSQFCCLVAEAHGCEQLAWGCSNPTDHYTTTNRPMSWFIMLPLQKWGDVKQRHVCHFCLSVCDCPTNYVNPIQWRWLSFLHPRSNSWKKGVAPFTPAFKIRFRLFETSCMV